MKNRKLEDLKAGDWVYHVVFGWKRITRIIDPNMTGYSIYAGGGTFTVAGMEFKGVLNPTIYAYNPFDPEDYHPQEFTYGEVVMVSEKGDTDWLPIIWKGSKHLGLFRQVRELTDREKGG